MTTKTSEVCQRDGLLWIQPIWPASERVISGTTCRLGGVSTAAFQALNLADHVADDIHRVEENRRKFKTVVGLPGEPLWLTQVHGDGVAESGAYRAGMRADGMYTRQSGQVCLVMTADCLPVLMTNEEGSAVAAIHAGWRGLFAGILSRAVQMFSNPANRLLVWLGPAISRDHYQVGDELEKKFLSKSKEYAAGFLHDQNSGRLSADLYSIARIALHQLGVEHIYGGEYCTYGNADWFYSYRRDGRTGRMGSFIYLRD